MKDATIDMHLADFRYSNLFWAWPEKSVFMAVGRFGQVIIIFSDRDIVAVTTGRDVNYSVKKLADLILESVKSDMPLPDDTAGSKLLADKILEVSTDNSR